MSVIDLGLSASDVVTAIISPLGGWVTGGLAIGVAVLAITFGYRQLCSYCEHRRDFEEYEAERARYEADYGEDGYL